MRGSTAIAGAVDVVVEYERPSGQAPAQHRQIVAVGRWTATPPLLLIDFDPATCAWRVVGEGSGREDGARASAREALLATLPAVAPGATLGEIEEATGKNRRDWHTTLSDLVDDGAVNRTGEGVKGKPYRYWRSPADSLDGFLGGAHKESSADGAEAIPCVPCSPRRGEAHGISLDVAPADSLASDAFELDRQRALVEDQDQEGA